MEGDVLEAARKLYQSNKAEVLSFQLNETSLDQGLICGGTLDVLIEPITERQTALMEKLKELRDAGEDVLLATFRETDGTISWKQIIRPHPLTPAPSQNGIAATNSFLKSQIPNLDIDLEEEARKAYHRHQTRRLPTPSGELFLEPVLGAPSLIIFGGGHVSRYLSRSASTVGFRVTVVDDRPEYANPQRFPEAAQTLAVEFVEAFDHLTILPSSYIVIVTRGHRSDEEILERVVKMPAKYIGMIGSKRKVLASFEHLLDHGVSAEELKCVHAPVGLEIGATTAEEIAVSVVAELIAVRRDQDVGILHKSKSLSEMIDRIENERLAR